MRLRDVGLNWQNRCPTCPVAAATRTRRGEGGKDSTLDSRQGHCRLRQRVDRRVDISFFPPQLNRFVAA